MNYRELNNTFKGINAWYKKKTKVLNIKSRPFNTAFIFYDILNKIINENGSVLYVICTTEEDFAVKNKNEYYERTIGKVVDGNKGGNVKFIFIDEINFINESYDLVIFDDITIFSKINSEKLRQYVEKIYWKCKKIIIYSCDKVFPIGEKMELIYLTLPVPMIEPRIISTRIKLEEDIPLVLYDYIKWYKDNRKNVLIVVPNESKLEKVYQSYKNTLKISNIRVVKYSKNDSFEFVKNIIDEENETILIVTDLLGSYINNIGDLNVIILFADDASYNYKKIVYTCGAINTKVNNLSEVLLVSRDISLEMDKSREIIRGFNKSLWDKRVLK